MDKARDFRGFSITQLNLIYLATNDEPHLTTSDISPSGSSRTLKSLHKNSVHLITRPAPVYARGFLFYKNSSLFHLGLISLSFFFMVCFIFPLFFIIAKG